MRRTPMPTRTTPLARTARLAVPLLSGTGKTRSAPRRETGFSPAVKLACRTRAGGGEVENALCEACGIWLGRYGGEIQHRASRGSGGCTDAVTNGLANAALLCGHGAAPIRSGCHGACEDREPHMAMDAGGFWIKHGTTPEFDPRLVPILLASAHGSGMKVWLSDTEPRYLTEAPELAA